MIEDDDHQQQSGCNDDQIVRDRSKAQESDIVRKRNSMTARDCKRQSFVEKRYSQRNDDRRQFGQDIHKAGEQSKNRTDKSGKKKHGNRSEIVSYRDLRTQDRRQQSDRTDREIESSRIQVDRQRKRHQSYIGHGAHKSRPAQQRIKQHYLSETADRKTHRQDDDRDHYGTKQLLSVFHNLSSKSLYVDYLLISSNEYAATNFAKSA